MSTTTTPGSKRRGLSCRTAMATLGIIALPFTVSGAAAAAAPTPPSTDSSFSTPAPAPSAEAPTEPAPAPAPPPAPPTTDSPALAAPAPAPAAPAPAAPAPAAPATAGDDSAAIDVFFAAGYSFTDAVVLADLWAGGDTYATKIKVGRLLAGGTELRNSAYADPGAAEGVEDETLAALFAAFRYSLADADVLAAQWGVSAAQATVRAGFELKATGVLPWVDPPVADDTAAIDAFFAAGYSYADAEFLSLAWGLSDPYAAKVKAGGYLDEGLALSASPYADPAADDGLTRRQLREAFSSFGYTADDARVLAEQWNVGVSRAKALAGAELKVVGVLPYVDLATSGDDTSGDEAYFNAFVDAGCSYDDAVVLADYWSLGEDTYAAKVKAGSFLVEGLPLPQTSPAVGC